MSRPKYKVTGFAKFFLFMLIFVPSAFFAINAAKGTSPQQIVENIKSKIKIGNGISLNKSDSDFEKIISEKEAEIQELKEKLFICEQGKRIK